MRRLSLETLVLILGVVAIVILISIYDLNGTLQSFSNLDPFYFLLALVAFFLFASLKIFPWLFVLRQLNLRMSFMQHLMLMYGFFGMGVLPSSIGQIFPLRYLDRFKKGARFFTLGIILTLGATGVLAVILLTLIASILVSQFVVYTIALFAILYAFVSLIGLKRLNKSIRHLANRFLKPNKHKIFRPLVRYINDLKKHDAFLSQKDILSEIGLFIPSLLAEAAMLYFILMALSQHVSFISVLFVFGVSVTVGNLSFLPAGLGATDTSMVALLLVFGAPGVIAIAATIIFRFLNTFAVFLLGYAALLYVKIKFPHRLSTKRLMRKFKS